MSSPGHETKSGVVIWCCLPLAETLSYGIYSLSYFPVCLTLILPGPYCPILLLTVNCRAL